MIHIKTEALFMDENVSVLIELPAAPRKGETIHLDARTQKVLEKKAKSSLDIAYEYYPKWFYGHSCNGQKPKHKNLKDLSFDDAIYVYSVLYIPNSDVIHIELNS